MYILSLGEGITDESDQRAHIVIVMAFQKPTCVTFSDIKSKTTISIGLTILGTAAFANFAPYTEWISDLDRMLKSSSIYEGIFLIYPLRKYYTNIGLDAADERGLRRVMGIAELDSYIRPELAHYN